LTLNIYISFSVSLKSWFYKRTNSKIIFFALNLHFWSHLTKKYKKHHQDPPLSKLPKQNLSERGPSSMMGETT